MEIKFLILTNIFIQKKRKYFTIKNDFDEVFSKVLKKGDYLMIKASNGIGLNSLSKQIIKGTKMLFSFLTSLVEEYSFLNVFKYLTFRTGLSVVTSLLIVFLL